MAPTPAVPDNPPRPLMEDSPKPVPLDPGVLERAKARPSTLGRRDSPYSDPKDCRHPVGSRIGPKRDMCSVCGTEGVK